MKVRKKKRNKARKYEKQCSVVYHTGHFFSISQEDRAACYQMCLLDLQDFFGNFKEIFHLREILQKINEAELSD